MIWKPVRFQPILCVMVWTAAVRIAVTDGMPPHRISELLTPVGETLWLGCALTAPLLVGAAWWLIRGCRLRGATLAGMWLRAGADIAMLAMVLTYHLANVLTMPAGMQHETVFGRYLTAAVMLFQAAIVWRDVRELVVVERLARKL